MVESSDDGSVHNIVEDGGGEETIMLIVSVGDLVAQRADGGSYFKVVKPFGRLHEAFFGDSPTD